MINIIDHSPFFVDNIIKKLKFNINVYSGIIFLKWYTKSKDYFLQLTEKIQTLEKSLSHMSREFNTEKRSIMQQARTENEAAKIELAKLQRVIDLKTREMNKVKRLAKNILDQRTELERFFLESLEQVRNEINANQ